MVFTSRSLKLIANINMHAFYLYELSCLDGSSTEVKCPRTTLVTRHKNKLIIQQQKTKKSSK